MEGCSPIREEDNNMPDVADDVIQGLYEASTGIVPWGQVLTRWHEAAQPVFAVQLLALDATSGRMQFSDASIQSPAQALLEHERQWHQSSPHIPHLLSLPVGELMHSAERFPPERYADHPFYRDYWARHGIRSIVAAKVAQDSHKVWLVAASRRTSHPPFTATDLLLMQRFVSHLAAGFRLAAQLRPARTAALVGQSLLQGSARPMLMLDEQRRVVGTNPAGEQWLARSQQLRVLHGQVTGVDSAATHELERAMRHVGLGPAARGSGSAANQRTALRLGTADGPPLLCSLWNLCPQDSLVSPDGSGVALLTVHADHELEELDTQWLGPMFNLTPAEVAVATQLMRGLEAKQIARVHHRSLHTVRSQMRSLLQKTGSRRQADLVRVLMRASQL